MSPQNSFSSLLFKDHRSHIGGVHALIFFPNGYGASVIRTEFSYGGPEGLYELAVIEGSEDDFRITHNTPVTDDVIG